VVGGIVIFGMVFTGVLLRLRGIADHNLRTPQVLVTLPEQRPLELATLAFTSTAIPLTQPVPSSTPPVQASAPSLTQTLPPAATATPSLPAVSIDIYDCGTKRGQTVDVGLFQPVVLASRWEAKTQAQIRDHLQAANYSITLDGAQISWVNISDAVYLSDKGYYRVSYTAPVGVLSPGKHLVERTITWAYQIFDGWGYYGPGSKTPTEHHTCVIYVH